MNVLCIDLLATTTTNFHDSKAPMSHVVICSKIIDARSYDLYVEIWESKICGSSICLYTCSTVFVLD